MFSPRRRRRSARCCGLQLDAFLPIDQSAPTGTPASNAPSVTASSPTAANVPASPSPITTLTIPKPSKKDVSFAWRNGPLHGASVVAGELVANKQYVLVGACVNGTDGTLDYALLNASEHQRGAPKSMLTDSMVCDGTEHQSGFQGLSAGPVQLIFGEIEDDTMAYLHLRPAS